MGTPTSLTQATKPAAKPAIKTLTQPHQFELGLGGIRLYAMTPTERQAAQKALAQLLLEAGSITSEESDHE